MRQSLGRISASAIVLSCFGFIAAKADEASELKLELMKKTSVIAVTKLSVPAEKYVSDGNPNTLEIVFMAKPEDGPSHVSDDGEVIFLAPDVTDRQQSALIGTAFDTRVKRQLAGQK